MMSTSVRFKRRKERVRLKLRNISSKPRLSIFKSGYHIYAQIIDDVNGNTVASASTLERGSSNQKKCYCNIENATKIGALISERAVAKSIHTVVFDKGGYRYHGVVKALADAAREKLEF